ncbi:nuclear transport factor 2 family protein [Catellatospora sp. NPDC049609]|uniref:nuclear transport factor 2 family protein n=1 Tax=Catellatospora sp. NPDC049609 TaxID=3155505 RepID=UPI003428B3B9
MTQSRHPGRMLGSLAGMLWLAGGTVTGRGRRRVERETRQQAGRFLDRLERKDAAAIVEMLHPEVTFTHPLSLSGRRADAGRWEGRDQVLGYLDGAFTMMGRIRFANRRTSVVAGGATAFVQADGDLTTADGRLYQNVYVFRIDWCGERIVAVEEYANPLTFCLTFDNPLCAGRTAAAAS